MQVIVGHMWIDLSGDVLVKDHTTGCTCTIRYFPYSYLYKDFQRKLTAVVADRAGKPRYLLTGHWDDRIEGCPIYFDDSAGTAGTSCTSGTNASSSGLRQPANSEEAPGSSEEEHPECTTPERSVILAAVKQMLSLKSSQIANSIRIGPSKLFWKSIPPLYASHYFLTNFALKLHQ